MQFNNIPLEIRLVSHWINWRYEIISSDKKPTKIPLRSRDGYKASVSRPEDFASFDDAVNAVQYCDGIGFCFTLDDPFCGIDLDEPEIAQHQTWLNEIYYNMQSYSELSPSSKGLHIICKAKLSGPGRRRKPVEIYDNSRFFTFTGKYVNSFQIENRQEQAEALYKELGISTFVAPTYIDETEQRSDKEIFDAASLAANGEKFLRLYKGDWQTDYGSQSQSEADFALINIISFYTRNRAQIMRIFRQSGLGQRDKAKRNEYLGWMITKSFDRLPPKVDIDELYNQRLEMLAKLGLKA